MPSPIVTNTGTSLNGKRLALTTDFSVLRPEDYGAVGDGVTDDTAAIQNCINAALLIGATILLGAKVYVVTGTLTINQNSGRPIKMLGQARYMDLQVLGISGTTIKFVSGAPATQVLYLLNANSVELGYFTIDCGTPTHSQTGLLIENCVGSHIHDIHIMNSSLYAFIMKANTSGVYRNLFMNLSTDKTCVQAMLHTSTNRAVNAVDVADNDFVRCDFFYTGAGGLAGVFLQSSDNNLFFGLVINCVNGTGAGESLVLGAQSAAQYGAEYNTFFGLDGGSLAGTARGVKADSDFPNVCNGFNVTNGLSVVAASAHPENFYFRDTAGVMQSKLLQLSNGVPFGGSTVPFQTYYDTSALKVRFQTHDPVTLRGFIFSGNAGVGAEQVLFEISNSGQIFERARTTALGEVINPAWAVGNFTSSGGGWTTFVGSTNVQMFREGKKATVKFHITASTVVNAGTLLISLTPFGVTYGGSMLSSNVCRVKDNGGAYAAGWVNLSSGTPDKIMINPMAGGNFAASATNTDVMGEVSFETSN